MFLRCAGALLVTAACANLEARPADADAAPSAAAAFTSLAKRVAAAPPPVPKPCPDAMAEIDGFCIDRFEASMLRESDRAPHSPYERPKDGEKHVAVSVK